MKNLDEPDSDQWTRVEYPSLMFDRSCDDYQVAPSAEKLAALIELIKANPTHPRLDEMISRTHDLVQDYRSKHAGSASATPAPAPAPASSDPNVTVTTATQRDMTIVTTHTNAPPSNPSPPN